MPYSIIGKINSRSRLSSRPPAVRLTFGGQTIKYAVTMVCLLRLTLSRILANLPGLTCLRSLPGRHCVRWVSRPKLPHQPQVPGGVRGSDIHVGWRHPAMGVWHEVQSREERCGRLAEPQRTVSIACAESRTQETDTNTSAASHSCGASSLVTVAAMASDHSARPANTGMTSRPPQACRWRWCSVPCCRRASRLCRHDQRVGGGRWLFGAGRIDR